MPGPPSHAGFAGLSSSRLHHEEQDVLGGSFVPHVQRVGNGPEALRYQRERGLANGLAGLPAEMATHTHGIGGTIRRPMTSGAGTPAHSTEVLSGGAVAFLEGPHEAPAPRTARGRDFAFQPTATRNHLDNSLAPREAEPSPRTAEHGTTFRRIICLPAPLSCAPIRPLPAPHCSRRAGLGWMPAGSGDPAGNPAARHTRSSMQGAGTVVTPAEHKSSENRGHGKRHLQGPPSWVAEELAHPGEVEPRVLSLSNRNTGPDGLQTALTYGETQDRWTPPQPPLSSSATATHHLLHRLHRL